MSSNNAALIEQFRADFVDYAKAGLEDFLTSVENEARRLAPVRKVYAESSGRKKTAWRTVFEASASSRRGAILAFAESNMHVSVERMQRFKVRKTSRGTYEVRVRSLKNNEPYSSEARSTWTKISAPSKYQLRRSYSATEPLAKMPGGGTYVFTWFGELNYEGRRALRRGIEQLETRGLQSIDRTPWSGERGSGMATVAGPETKAVGKHREAIPQVILGGDSQDRFGSTYTLQLGGTLRKSIEMMPPEVVKGRISGSVRANARYALYVEFGTAKHGKAQPYLRPALMRYRYLLAKSVSSNVRHRNAS